MFSLFHISKHLCVLALFLLSTALHANELVKNTVDQNDYGYAFNGVNTNITTADFTFDGGTEQLKLTLDTYDIDSVTEVEVLLNGSRVSFLGKTVDNGFGQNTIILPQADQVNGINALQFKQRRAGYKWGIRNLLLTVDDAIPELIVGTTLDNAYGYGFNGLFTHRKNAVFTFQGSANDLLLTTDSYDIDSSVEVAVKVNDSPIGNLSVTTNNGNGQDSFLISADQQLPGENTLEFTQRNAGWVWGIENLLLSAPSIVQLTIDDIETGKYGYNFNGVSTNKDEAIFQFTSNGQKLTLNLDAYDIDSSAEVKVFFNDSPVGNLALTENNALGNSEFSLPSTPAGTTNTIRFRQKNSGWRWGVTNITIYQSVPPHLDLNEIHANAYGFSFNGAIQVTERADFTFNHSNISLQLNLDGYDIDGGKEVDVLVNDINIGNLKSTPNNGLGPTVLTIPTSVLQPQTNMLSFVQKNPGWRWGIANIVLTTVPTQPDLSKFDMVFNDEFNGSELDANNWDTGLLWGPYLPINDEQQLYVDTLGINQGASYDPFELTGDSLIIRATPTGNGVQPPARPAENDPIWDDYAEYRYNGPNDNGPGYDPFDVEYLSGIITSNSSFNMTHGYIEARVKLPAGQGLWPAFWLLNQHYVEDVPEIDIMEFLGQNTDKVYHTYHYFEPENDWAKISTPTYESTHTDWTQTFHTFGMLWSPREIIWYVDGVETKRITDSEFKISKQAMYILANLAVGGTWPGEADASTPFPAEYEIDYIRAYKKKLNPSLDLNADYQLMFNDEFDGNALDTNKWNTSFLWGPYFAINNEEQYYVDSAGTDQNIGYTPFEVSNGTLKITAQSKDDSPPNVPPTSLPGPNEQIWLDNPEFQQGPYIGAPDYTSGMITSYDSFKFVNGYAEIRAKVPRGDGLWPAFWLLNAYYVGTLPEIDIMEILGESPNKAYHTFHRWTDNGMPVSDQFTSSHGTSSIGYSDDFHTFGVRWRPGVIEWYVDGQLVDTYTETDDNRAYQLMYVIANLAVGGNFNTQAVDPAALPAKFEIDYIRVYQENDY